MSLLLFRHGKTQWNQEGRYLGRTDQPLCPQGRDELIAWRGAAPRAVYTSPLLRCRQTAQILFPGRELRSVPGWEEMDFGIFEGHTWQELAADPETGYQAWVDGECQGSIPQGESKDVFCLRVTDAFWRLVQTEELDGTALVVHGGTIMALLEVLGEPRQPFYHWHCGNGAGWEAQWQKETGRLMILRPISARKEEETR